MATSKKMAAIYIFQLIYSIFMNIMQEIYIEAVSNYNTPGHG